MQNIFGYSVIPLVHAVLRKSLSIFLSIIDEGQNQYIFSISKQEK